MKIVSEIGERQITQYVMTQSKNDTYEDKLLNIRFSGVFGIITLNGNGDLQDMYIGEGEKLQYRREILKPKKGARSAYKLF